MEDLLKINFIAQYGLPPSTVTNFIIETSEPYFEIEDTNTGEIVKHTESGLGMAKFSNSNSLSIKIVNYDKFVTEILDESFKNGRKRCDIILSCFSDRYFVLGELKDRNPKAKVRSIAKKQLLDSLQTLLAVPEIKDYINSKAIKRCCYFNKQATTPTRLIATNAFNRLTNIYQDGFKMNNPDIESFGFEFFEFTGQQTMKLTA